MIRLVMCAAFGILLTTAAPLPPASAGAAATPAAAYPGLHTDVRTGPPTGVVVSARRPAATGRWARQRVERGDRDVSPTRIEHVRELQYRLRWAGAYRGEVTGFYGRRTEQAVRRYQRQHRLEPTGTAGRRTWKKLLPDTVRGRRSVPRDCRTSGWHACYDRHRHQVTLWHDGRMRNTWLVRGGAHRHATRTGTFTVFGHSRHHVSSLYGSPMPYAQFFSGGQALHASYNMVDPFTGHSHGCVNMYIDDARQLWTLTAHKRLHVRVYGRWS